MSCKADLTVKPEVTPFFDPATNTISYVVKDPGSDACAVVDSVMDIDYAAGRISYESADAIIAFVRDRGLKVIAQCSFVRAWIDRHSEYRDLLA